MGERERVFEELRGQGVDEKTIAYLERRAGRVDQLQEQLEELGTKLTRMEGFVAGRGSAGRQQEEAPASHAERFLADLESQGEWGAKVAPLFRQFQDAIAQDTGRRQQEMLAPLAQEVLTARQEREIREYADRYLVPHFGDGVKPLYERIIPEIRKRFARGEANVSPEALLLNSEDEDVQDQMTELLTARKQRARGDADARVLEGAQRMSSTRASVNTGLSPGARGREDELDTSRPRVPAAEPQKPKRGFFAPQDKQKLAADLEAHLAKVFA